MPRPIPIFRNHEGTYQADTCRPLVEAATAGQVSFQALARGHYPGRRLPNHVLRGIKTIGHWDAVTGQQWGLQWHRNEGVELTFLESGRMGFAVDGSEYVLQPDDLTVTRPWQVHRVGDPNIGPGRLHWLIIDVRVRRPNQPWRWPSWLMLRPAELEELTNILRHNEQPVWRGSTEVRRCFQSIAQAVETDRDGSSTSRLTVRINDLFLLLLDLLRSQKIRLDGSLSGSRRTVQLFLADFTTQPEHLALKWTVGKMAGSCGLGVTQFVHHVRQLTNVAPMHFLNQCRLDFAAKLLRESPEKSVTDVAFTCGFSSSQYFATLFSRRFGVSPREFRKLNVTRWSGRLGLNRADAGQDRAVGAARLGRLEDEQAGPLAGGCRLSAPALKRLASTVLSAGPGPEGYGAPAGHAFPGVPADWHTPRASLRATQTPRGPRDEAGGPATQSQAFRPSRLYFRR